MVAVPAAAEWNSRQASLPPARAYSPSRVFTRWPSSGTRGYWKDSAPDGHTVLQVPQPLHSQGSTAITSPWLRIAAVEQASMQFVQPVFFARLWAHRPASKAT